MGLAMYKKEHFYRIFPNGHKQKGVQIIANNGVKIAECSTIKTADKIVSGLILYDDDQKKKADFKL